MDTRAFVAVTPVVDIDGTLFVQGGIFLLLVATLHPLLFRPWLLARERRIHAIDGALTHAAIVREQSETMSREYENMLADARARANELRSEAHHQQELELSTRLASERNEASQSMTRHRTELLEQSNRARKDLNARIDQLAAQIVAKVLGRST